MDELAGDKCSIRKRAASCVLPGKRRRDGLHALNADPVVGQIKRFQWGAEQIKPNRNAEKRVSILHQMELSACNLQLNAPREHRRDRLRALDADPVAADVQLVQWGTENPTESGKIDS